MELAAHRLKNRNRWIKALLLCFIIVGWFLSQETSGPPVHKTSRNPPAIQVASQRPVMEKPPAGEAILQGYAAAGTTVQQDLTLMSHVLGNFALLVKGDDPLPLGANEEIAAALRGRNRAQLRFVPETSPIFDAQGQIIDRWGTPLYFHAASHDRVEIRSAGPDKIMWTADDVQRQSNGTFLSTEDMQAPSLLEQSLQRRGSWRK